MEDLSNSHESERFSDLESLCLWLETHATDFKYDHEIGQLFQRIRDDLARSGDDLGATQAQWEVDAFNFVPKDGKLSWQFQGTDKEGNPFEYPSMERLDDKAFTYFAQRLTESKSPILRARYSHLLWEGPTKRQQFASSAISAYLELVPIHEAKDQSQPDGHFGQDVVSCLTNAFLLSVANQADSTKPKRELFRVLTSFPESSSSWFRLRHNLVSLLLENKKHFTDQEIGGIPEFCLATAETLLPRNVNSAITMYELGDKADKRLGKQTTDWNLKIASAFETLMIRGGKESVSASHFCEKSLEYYRKAKDQTKIRELEWMREEFAKKIQLQAVETQIDLTEHIRWCQDTAAKFAAKETDEIVSSLAADPAILPDPDDVLRLAKESLKNHPLLSLSPETILDKRGHVVQYAINPEEKERAEFYKVYNYFMRVDKVHLIHEILSSVYVAGKLNFDLLKRFLEAHSWLCQTLKFEVANHSIEYRWIDALEPGLKTYFELLQTDADESRKSDLLVLTIDSLTLKFEGIVRDLCRLTGAITTFDKIDKQSGKMVTHEKDISVLLREPSLESVLDKRELLFLKYLLTEKLGQNLRHNIAHCLLNREDYDLGKAHLVLIGILRLSQLKLD